MKLRVLVVDDSPFIRRILTDWIKAEDDFELVGTANDGAEAVEAVKRLKPDVVTMDVEMPKMDGIAALRRIMQECPTPVIMVSSLTTDGADASVTALEVGAIDLLAKPGGGSSLKFVQSKAELVQKLKAAKYVRLQKTVRTTRPGVAPSFSGNDDRVLLVASSTGGPKALVAFFQGIPSNFPAPCLIVQHMPVGFTASLARRIDALGGMACKEAEDGDRLAPGLALLAPGGKHMTVDAAGRVSLDDRAPIHGVRPAADIMFESAAKAFGKRCFGVVFTGMGRDGAQGALAVRQAGGKMFGECEESCVVYGMPRAAKEIGGIDREVHLDGMAAEVVAEFSGSVRRAS
ncbi:MAG: chemotaxis response regulator protein-glutamate methylesterase [Fimbriimonadaceae bacterium]|nr:chemotaxis response regulator protein-glutamate methylesterase [Fimbriimonadaceae bacterium]QYK56182.1 MAG: chemotaxis response regulator protein-glutamate methylesterase [Fimbriimonadaceae bacterium]